MERFKDRRVIVTGAGSGFGEAIAKRFQSAISSLCEPTRWCLSVCVDAPPQSASRHHQRWSRQHKKEKQKKEKPKKKKYRKIYWDVSSSPFKPFNPKEYWAFKNEPRSVKFKEKRKSLD